MAKYEVRLLTTKVIGSREVEADNAEEAEDKAWEMFDKIERAEADTTNVSLIEEEDDECGCMIPN